jgi:ribosome-binding protein aMBF1 (putative translation factor)
MADDIPDHAFADWEPDPERCEVCGREVPTETHHLHPQNRKESPTADVCTPCHKQLHAVFTNHELRQEYDTPDAIREADRMADFVAWIRKTNKTTIQVSESERVREWRR